LNWADKIRKRVVEWPFIRQLILFLKGTKPPGFKGNSLYDVGSFFMHFLLKENIHLRASSMAYSFFLSLFPFLLFLLTLIAYVPLGDLKSELLENLNRVLPSSSFNAIKHTVTDILQNERGGLLSVGFAAAIYFSSNGIMTIVSALNRNTAKELKRSIIKKRLTAIWITLTSMIVLILLMLALFFMHQIELKWMEIQFLPNWCISGAIFIIEALVLSFGLLLLISGVYYFAPANKSIVRQFHFFSPGSILATFLIISTAFVFQFYVNNIFQYNSVYGSIGAVIALLLLLYFTASCIIIGFELNLSIDKAVNSKLDSRQFILKNL
jgi:membrane protein